MKKRWLSILLTLCMALALLPFGTVFALDAGNNDVYSVGADAGIMPAVAVDDHTPPTVTGVYMNSPGATVTVGDKLLFTVSTEDESGIYMGLSRLTFTYVCEQNHQHEITVWGNESYDEEAKQATFEIEISDGMLNGTYKLSQVQIYDIYHNYTSFRRAGAAYPEDPGNPGNIDFDAVYFAVTGTSAVEDHVPPTVSSVSMEEPGKVVTVGDKLLFTVSTEDESGIYMGLSRLTFTYVCEQNHQHNITAWGNESYDEEAKQATFEIEISDGMLNGTYKLSQVQICDIYHNYTSLRTAGATYPEDPGNSGNIDFDAVYFAVTGTSAVEDHVPPTVSSVSMEEPGKVVTVGDKLLFTVSTEDESGIYMGLSRLTFTYVCEQNHQHEITVWGNESYDEEAKQATFEIGISDGMLNGTYKLSQVQICDIYHNYTSLRTAGAAYPEDPGNPGSIDFDAIYFTIAIPDILPEAVSIPETLSLPVRSAQTIRPNVTPVDSLPRWTWTSADTSIAEVVISENNKSCTITGVAPGVTTITGTTQNGLTATCEVTVTDAPLPESGTVDALYTVGVGGFVDIVPVLTPADATTLYEVTSDNPHVAGVGVTPGHTGIRIEGNNAGTAVITIRGANGLIMTTTVKVGRDGDRQHEKTTVSGYAPTCTREGRTDAVRCSACWYMFTEAQIIPPTGHSFGGWTIVLGATATTTGIRERTCESCGYRERETIPATGELSSGGDSGWNGDSVWTDDSSWDDDSSSSNNSGSTSGGSSPANQTVIVTANERSIEAVVNSGTAEVSVADKRLVEIIENTPAGEPVTLDISLAKNISEVSIPQGIVEAIHNSGSVSSLSIVTEKGSVEMGADALETMYQAMTGENDRITVKVDPIDVNTIPATQKYPIANVLNSAVFVELSASVIHRDSAGNPISTESLHEFNGSVTVSVPYERPTNMEGRQMVACYIADDGAITYFPVKYENGIATFTTTHFSLFAVLESKAAAFQDVDISAWYMPGVEYTLQNSLMNGISGGKFGTKDPLSRAQLAQILFNKEGGPMVNDPIRFDDVSGEAWYAGAIHWAASQGITDGCGNGLFAPNDPITREQLAVMLWRYAGRPAATSRELRFSDADQAGDYALEALAWAVESGVLNGFGDGRLGPQGQATRAQAAQMLMNFVEKQKNG